MNYKEKQQLTRIENSLKKLLKEQNKLFRRMEEIHTSLNWQRLKYREKM